MQLRGHDGRPFRPANMPASLLLIEMCFHQMVIHANVRLSLSSSVYDKLSDPDRHRGTSSPREDLHF